MPVSPLIYSLITPTNKYPPRDRKSIIDEVTTLRRHLDAMHSGKYRKWAKGVNFTSKLPSDVKRRKAAAVEAIRTLDDDLREIPPAKQVVPYSSKAFLQRAIEWLVATDQPIQALQHSTFKALLDITSRATNGVNIPGRKTMRCEIMRAFRDHLIKLRARFNV
ncbi:hypothetical protein BGW80DRAFT_1167494 [Lactifluus volemus]|nr:hypothetical protein BGW80DRAFT_1176878 [Lactifluus volemus]KAH9976583.1 hypothetical protein BGW80DRAFT_1167494 [Lactifluus volemus]